MRKKIINIFFCVLTYVFFLFRGSAKKEVTPRTFVVMYPTGNIGDMVCTTPLFRAIKVAYPHARVIVIGYRKNALILEGNPDVDAYIMYEQSLFTIIKLLRKERADAGVIINLSASDFFTLFLGGVKRISCFTFGPNTMYRAPRSYDMISRLGVTTVYIPGEYIPRQNLKLLEAFNVSSDDIQKHQFFSEEGSKNVDRELERSGISERGLVALAPGAGTKIKQWPPDRFAAVANYLFRKYGLCTLLIGGPDDSEATSMVIKSLDATTRRCDFTGQSIDELKATLSKVQMIIGNDSAPIYIAESFGAATLVLIGPTDEGEHPLRDETHRIVRARKSGDALLKSYLSSEDTVDFAHGRSQMEAISVEDVCRELDDLVIYLKLKPGLRRDTVCHKS